MPLRHARRCAGGGAKNFRHARPAPTSAPLLRAEDSAQPSSVSRSAVNRMQRKDTSGGTADSKAGPEGRLQARPGPDDCNLLRRDSRTLVFVRPASPSGGVAQIALWSNGEGCHLGSVCASSASWRSGRWPVCLRPFFAGPSSPALGPGEGPALGLSLCMSLSFLSMDLSFLPGARATCSQLTPSSTDSTQKTYRMSRGADCVGAQG